MSWIELKLEHHAGGTHINQMHLARWEYVGAPALRMHMSHMGQVCREMGAAENAIKPSQK